MRNQLLRDTDWASMAHALEVRVPLVDSVAVAEGRSFRRQYTHCHCEGVPFQRSIETAACGRPQPEQDWFYHSDRAMDEGVVRPPTAQVHWSRPWSITVETRARTDSGKRVAAADQSSCVS